MKALTIILSLLIINFADKKFQHKDNVTEKVNSLMEDCKELDLFSGTILVAKDGKIEFENSYGFADKDKNILNTNNTKYNIGSIGKEFTAIMILQLMQENKLKLSDELGKYFNFFPEPAASEVTIKNLLDHTSGYGDYIMDPEFQMNKENYKELSELVKFISKEEPEFKSGAEKRYSNSGYVILGGIIEKITGKSYSDNMKERIFDPLGMNSSGYIDWESKDLLKATGYLKNIKNAARDNNDLRLQGSPAGGMYSTTEDLLKLDQSLMNDNKLLDDKFKMILFSDFIETPSASLNDRKKNPDAENVIAGGAPGINALYMSFPGKGYTVIILSNYDQAAENIEPQITDIIKRGDYKKPNLPLGQFLYKTYEKEGNEYFVKNIKMIIDENGYRIPGPGMLNNTGYQFLQNEIPDAAISIFRLNAEMFPEVANCFDSLGEAYFMTGNKEDAKINYAKVLQLDPGNENAKKMLEKLN
ncbi:MAG TPA: serine hydrolase domain-containing protein [Ignavibacteria bacterium]|nr:serine hydrolase domain-containing protein [Ignavibacteria bacterium]